MAITQILIKGSAVPAPEANGPISITPITQADRTFSPRAEFSMDSRTSKGMVSLDMYNSSGALVVSKRASLPKISPASAVLRLLTVDAPAAETDSLLEVDVSGYDAGTYSVSVTIAGKIAGSYFDAADIAGSTSAYLAQLNGSGNATFLVDLVLS